MPPSTAVKIKLDRERKLRITWRALETLHDEHGLTLADLGDQLAEQSMRSIRMIIWLGLLHEDPGLTFDQTADLLDEADLGDVMQAAAALVGQRFGGPGNGQAAGGGKPKKGPTRRKKVASGKK